MKIIKLKPRNNSLRAQIKLSHNLLTKDSSFLRKLLFKKVSSYGRSSPVGKMSSWHRQRGAKKLYRPVLDENIPSSAILISSVYDPNKSNYLSLNFDLKKKRFFYTNSILKITSGSLIQKKILLKGLNLGFRTKISALPEGSLISNVGNLSNRGSVYIKAAGTHGQLLCNYETYSVIKLPSNKLMNVSSDSFATLGGNDNNKYGSINMGKAGRNRNKGRRPTVRGIAMNPVDHPHGGRTNGGRPSVTPWGIPTKNKFYLRKKSYV